MNDGNNICHSKIHQMATTSATKTWQQHLPQTQMKLAKHLQTTIQAHLPGGCNVYHIKTMAITSAKSKAKNNCLFNTKPKETQGYDTNKVQKPINCPKIAGHTNTMTPPVLENY